ncbi:hypothetical protein MCOR02_006507 [Pyricularia oryzae]|uniref:BTB domain-containing protein n=1 Tax=Pyricularia oryzae TaxID=318829 RepID=A0A4P7NJ35_PYROR|nr:hypothetical protein MCOR02_006507 [Pyricularia oryzae]KAI6317120.1 hypothetical protein MCOR34_004097 [Pyricularia oryzae]KAI6454568.1 hypothetical protein MCOR17_008983 [Pyricularia oryzae]KAI6570221.1 hypothetical protein MCOR04_008149 [Pyricularia oryzae]QBZ62061.1 hypothetical protein PoMZ_10935 [Pyricularia oryzae]
MPPHPRDHQSGVGKMSFPRKYFEGLQSMLRSGELADLIITCKGRTFNVHRMILSAQSGFFRGACTGNFKEAFTGRIDLPEDDPDILEILIEYIYRGQLPRDLVACAVSDLRHNSEFHSLARSSCATTDRHIATNRSTAPGGPSLKANNTLDDLTPTSLAKARQSSEGYYLWTYAKIYLLADKYQVLSLQVCALNQVNCKVHILLARPYAGLECIAWMLDDIFGKVANTKSHIELKEPLLRLAISMSNDATTWEDLQPVMRSRPDLALGLANYYHFMNGRKCVGCCAEEKKKGGDSGVLERWCYSCDDGSTYMKRRPVYPSSDENQSSRENTIAIFAESWKQKELMYEGIAGTFRDDH